MEDCPQRYRAEGADSSECK